MHFSKVIVSWSLLIAISSVNIGLINSIPLTQSKSLESISGNVTNTALTPGNTKVLQSSGVEVWPWATVAAIIVKFCVVAKLIMIFGWGWIMTQLGIGTKEFHDQYFALTTTSTEKSITNGYYSVSPQPTASSYGRYFTSTQIQDDLLEYIYSKVETAFEISRIVQNLVS